MFETSGDSSDICDTKAGLLLLHVQCITSLGYTCPVKLLVFKFIPGGIIHTRNMLIGYHVKCNAPLAFPSLHNMFTYATIYYLKELTLYFY